MNKEYYPTDILAFYRRQRFMHFIFLTPKRLGEIRSLAELNRPFFIGNMTSLSGLMSSAACKLTTAAKNYGLKNSDEIIFFYLTLVDPDFTYLEAYECANRKYQVRTLCIENMGIYDPYIIYYEVLFQRRFRFPELEDLWTRGRINTDVLFDKHGIAK